MKKILILLLLALLPVMMMAQKYSVHHYLPTLSMTQARSYIGYDEIIIDFEVPNNSSVELDWLVKNSPGLKVTYYFNLPEWFNPMFANKPQSIKIVDFLNKIPEWWLKGRDGKRISFWPGMQTMNCSVLCPRVIINGRKYNYVEFMTELYIDNVLKPNQAKRVLLDNFWEKAFWLGHYKENQSGIDIDGDGWADDSVKVDRAWKAGMEYALNKIKQYGGNNFVIIGNPGSAPFDISTMFEDFPLIYANEEDSLYEAWFENMNLAASRKGHKIFNSRKDNYFFTLCSSMLLDDVYFSYIQNSPYEKKWELNLGKALDKAKPTVSGEEYMRHYENGAVYVNPGLKTARVEYGDGTIRTK